MQTINLTDSRGEVIRAMVEHIVAYGPTNGSSGSEVILTVHNTGNCVLVKESPADIDKLLGAV